MSLSVFLVVLAAAALHASWNALVKGAADKLSSAILISAFASLLAAPLLPFLALPAAESWPFLLTSTLLQVVYYLLVAGAYRHADLGATYPVMRGGAPLLTAAVMAFALGEPLSPGGWAGILMVSAGILGLAAGAIRRGAGGRGLAFALVNVGVIAGYTVTDGLGVRRSGAPVAYTLWIFLLTGLPLLAWGLVAMRGRLAAAAARHWREGLLGAGGTMLSYGAVLWAMTQAPVAMVAALRETAILFGLAISVLVLREPATAGRIAAAALIAAGAVALRLAPA